MPVALPLVKALSTTQLQRTSGLLVCEVDEDMFMNCFLDRRLHTGMLVIPGRMPMISALCLGYLPPAGMSIDDFEVVEFLQEAKGDGDEFEETITKGSKTVTKTSRTLRTTMRTDFRGKVVIPPRRAGGSVTILPMHDSCIAPEQLRQHIAARPMHPGGRSLGPAVPRHGLLEGPRRVQSHIGARSASIRYLYSNAYRGVIKYLVHALFLACLL